jgi:hypothetical protein
VLLKLVTPLGKAPPLPELALTIVALPAVELFKKLVTPPSLFPIICVWFELFTMPTPTKEKEFPNVPIEKALAPELNVIESMVTVFERDSEVIVEVLNVAVSPALTGTVGGFQLPFVFQSPDPGLVSQSASTASAGAAVATTSRSAQRAMAKNL